MNQSLKDKFGFLLAVIFACGFGYFSPSLAQTDVSRTKLWAKYVADSIGVSDGSGITLWENLQGAMLRDLQQLVSADKPILKTGILNGHAVARFDGISDWMEDLGEISTGVTEAEIYVVIKADNDPATSSTTNGWHYTLASSVPPTSFSSHYPHTSGDIYESFRRVNSRVNFNPSPALTTFRLYSVHADTNKYTIRIDTTTVFNSASAYTLDNSGDIKIGRSSNSTSFFDGDIAELRIYIGKLTDAQRDTVYYHFDTKYGLAFDPPVGISEPSQQASASAGFLANTTRFDTLSVALVGAGAKDTLWVTPSESGRMYLTVTSQAKIPGRTVSFPKKLTVWTDRLSGSSNTFRAYWLPINPLTGTLSKNDSTYVIGTSGAAAALVSGTSYSLTPANARGFGIVVSQVSSGTNVIRFCVESSQ